MPKPTRCFGCGHVLFQCESLISSQRRSRTGLGIAESEAGLGVCGGGAGPNQNTDGREVGSSHP